MASSDTSGVCYLYRLSDCVLLKLLSFLDATSLYQLSRTTKFFRQLVKDKQLWRYIDARNAPNTDKKVNFVVDLIHDRSQTVLLRAHSHSSGLVQENFFQQVASFDNLSILALENQLFDGETITIKHFPKCLEELSLRGTFISKCKNFFRLSKDHVPHLRVLILDDCQWVDCGCLMSISKYQNLEILSLVKCRRLNNDSVAYFGLARLGYKKLRIFDGRFTVLAQPVLTSFHQHNTLLAYYFQHERSDTRELEERPDRENHYYCFTDLYDSVLATFMNITGTGQLEPLPTSRLYVDPYGDCTCDYKSGAKAPLEELKTDTNCPSCLNAQVLVQEPCAGDSSIPAGRTCRRHDSDLLPLVWHSHEPPTRPLPPPPEPSGEGPPPEEERRPDDAEDGPPAAKRPRVVYTRQVHLQRQRPDGAEPGEGPSALFSWRQYRVANREQAYINVDLGNLPRAHIGFDFRLLNRMVNGEVEILPADRVPARVVPLRRLSLRGYSRVTDEALLIIKDLQLDLLDLTYTGCTEEGVRKYLTYNPNCRVIHKDFCRCRPTMPF